MTTLPLQSETTIASPTAGTGVDISSSTYGFVSGTPPTGLRLWVRVYGADPSTSLAAMIQIQSSTNAFETYLTHAIFNVPPGPIGSTSNQSDTGSGEGNAPASRSFLGTGTQFPVNSWTVSVGQNDQAVGLIPWGVSSAVLRVNVVILNSAKLTYEAWFTLD